MPIMSFVDSRVEPAQREEQFSKVSSFKWNELIFRYILDKFNNSRLSEKFEKQMKFVQVFLPRHCI